MSGNFTAALELVQRWVQRGSYRGASLVVGSAAESLVERSFGDHSSEREEFIASAGKWLAAAAIATVVDEGKLSWDGVVADWLPEFSGGASTVTLRQSLSHTSGMAPQQPEGRRV